MGVADDPPNLPDDGGMWHLNHLPSLLDVMADHGDAGKPIWFTEFGWSVHPDEPGADPWDRGVTAAEQADFLTQTVHLVRDKYPMVTRMYSDRARTELADPLRAGYGLVFPDGDTMPAWKNCPRVLAEPSTWAATQTPAG